MSKLDERLDRLKERKLALAEELKRLENQQRTQERKRDNRRKLLVGSYVLELVEQGNFDKAALQAGLDEFLTKAGERELFDLPPLPAVDSSPSRTTTPAVAATASSYAAVQRVEEEAKRA